MYRCVSIGKTVGSVHLEMRYIIFILDSVYLRMGAPKWGARMANPVSIRPSIVKIFITIVTVPTANDASSYIMIASQLWGLRIVYCTIGSENRPLLTAKQSRIADAKV